MGINYLPLQWILTMCTSINNFFDPYIPTMFKRKDPSYTPASLSALANLNARLQERPDLIIPFDDESVSSSKDQDQDQDQ